jgi:hypothetical protein
MIRLLSALARKSISEIIRDKRSSSSAFDARTSWYSSQLRPLASMTWVWVSRLLTGVRSSCARYDEKSESWRKDSSRRASISFSVSARATSSTGTASTGRRAFSRWAVIAAASRLIACRGASSLRTAIQPSRPIDQAANTMKVHRVVLKSLMKCSWCEISVATATSAGGAPAMPVRSSAEMPRKGCPSALCQRTG